jgi:ADP-ribose pyrophosphatase
MTHFWTPQFSQSDVTLVNEQLSYPGFCQVKTFQFKIPFFEGGKSDVITRDVLIRPPAVAVLLYDPDSDLVMLIEQFRAGVYALVAVDEINSTATNQKNNPSNPWILETVAGMLEPEHSLLETAAREVKEETGCVALSLTPICTYVVSPGISSEKTHIYYGRFRCASEGERLHYTKYAGLKEEGEDIKVHLLPAETVFRFLQEGTLLSASTVIAIQWLALHRGVLRSLL